MFTETYFSLPSCSGESCPSLNQSLVHRFSDQSMDTGSSRRPVFGVFLYRVSIGGIWAKSLSIYRRRFFAYCHREYPKRQHLENQLTIIGA